MQTTKTPDEIKKGPECCGTAWGDHKSCDICPYVGWKCSPEMHDNALALIKRLEAQIPKWISVEERLPEDEERVLFFAKEPRLTIDTAYGWWVNTTNRYKVTHWMPLPEPPKEDGA